MSEHSSFIIPTPGSSTLVYATHTGDSSATPPVEATGEVTPLLRSVDPASGDVSYTSIDGKEYTFDDTVVTIDSAPVRITLAHEILTVDDTVKQLDSVPELAVHAECQLYPKSNALFTAIGTDPDAAAGLGKLINKGASFELEGDDELKDFKIVSLNAAGDGVSGVENKLYVEYHNVTEDGTYRT